ncbi:membrane protein [Arthrobacter phage Tuck]|uniref:Membrane protein n=1 Tax=Arthrobacter phage Tuck TaxID=2998996 RepID=A0A9E8S3P0_9CAUD|nr:membrane protein [Arthrobacter phage Tuck]
MKKETREALGTFAFCFALAFIFSLPSLLTAWGK